MQKSYGFASVVGLDPSHAALLGCDYFRKHGFSRVKVIGFPMPSFRFRAEVFHTATERGRFLRYLLGCDLLFFGGGSIIKELYASIGRNRYATLLMVLATVTFSRGLFGKPANPAFIEGVLKDLSLWDKRDSKIMTLSGGMKRRVLIAKALAHEPQILFLDEPTAGVDVELRQDMWKLVRRLRDDGVTIILTTHYIEEAEEMADRVGVISKGEIILVEEKAELMRKLGRSSSPCISRPGWMRSRSRCPATA